MNIFGGLLGYERLVLICGFILFVFALAAITVMIVQRRDFKMAMVDRLRAQPTAPTDPAQQQQSAQTLSAIEERSADNPQLQARVADGYRAIGEVDKGYQLAQSLLQQKPSAQVQAALVPVLTAKLNEVQADAPIAPPAPAPAASSSTFGTTPLAPTATAAGTPASAGTVAMAPSAAAPAPAALSPTESSKQSEIAAIAKQLQGTGAPVPAASHAALAKAYVVLGQPRQAQTNVDAALKLNPNIKINAAVLHAARMGSTPRPTEQ
ncbi:MAG TPA: hypothetical protein VIM06_06625 [Rhodanobacter sp.]